MHPNMIKKMDQTERTSDKSVHPNGLIVLNINIVQLNDGKIC